METRPNLKYTKEHEWIQINDDNTAVIDASWNQVKRNTVLSQLIKSERPDRTHLY